LANNNKEIVLRRRPSANKGGRPRLEEIGILTPEMEDIAQRVRAGYTPEEIAEELKCGTDRVMRLIQNPLTSARIQHLLGDRLQEIARARDRLFDAVIESTIRMLQKDVFPPTLMEKLVERLDPYERVMKDENPLTQKLKKHLLSEGNQTEPSQGMEEGVEDLFGPMEMEGE